MAEPRQGLPNLDPGAGRTHGSERERTFDRSKLIGAQNGRLVDTLPQFSRIQIYEGGHRGPLALELSGEGFSYLAGAPYDDRAPRGKHF